MIGPLLRLLVFVIAGFAFAVFALWKDRQEHAAKIKKAAEDDAQASIYFPEHKPNEDRDHGGAAMSRL
jgi:hypothetical protein